MDRPALFIHNLSHLTSYISWTQPKQHHQQQEEQSYEMIEAQPAGAALGTLRSAGPEGEASALLPGNASTPRKRWVCAVVGLMMACAVVAAVVTPSPALGEWMLPAARGSIIIKLDRARHTWRDTSHESACSLGIDVSTSRAPPCVSLAW